MQIVWDQDIINELKAHHTLLELETFDINGKSMVTYCVVPADKLLADIDNLGSYINLHSEFVQAYKDKNFKLCVDISEHLMGRFGGELDSFYTEILSRIN